MSLQENLKKLMLRCGNMSVSDLARATKLPQPTLHQLCCGITSSPRQKTLAVLADYFSITPAQLLGQDNLPDQLTWQMKQQLNIMATPILLWEDLPAWPDRIDVAARQEIILEHNTSPNTFAIEMLGSSMEPLFPEGTLLIFDSQKRPKDRDCVMIYLQDHLKFCFKRLLIDGNTVWVKSINPELQGISTLKVSAEDKIIATLLEARIRF
jgi:transcriptional regulator with XRE-family HTH domain